MKRKTVTADEARKLLAEKPKRSKYGVRQDPAGKAARTVDGTIFDSQGEATRYAELRTLERSGQITNLERQRSVILLPKIGKIGAIACVIDFTYHERGYLVFEDFKGAQTAAWRLKLNLMRRILMRGEIIRMTRADGTVKEWTA